MGKKTYPPFAHEGGHHPPIFHPREPAETVVGEKEYGKSRSCVRLVQYAGCSPVGVRGITEMGGHPGCILKASRRSSKKMDSQLSFPFT